MKLVCLSQKDSRVFVKSIVAGGQSEANGQVLAGHQILKIALQDVTKLSLEKVLQILWNPRHCFQLYGPISNQYQLYVAHLK